MRNLLIITCIFLFSCTKQDRFRVVASGEKYNITIETNESTVTYTNLEGDFKETVRAEIAIVYGNPVAGEVTYELFKNGDLCAGVYNSKYISGQLDIKTISCN